jgi:hypothetical protein
LQSIFLSGIWRGNHRLGKSSYPNNPIIELETSSDPNNPIVEKVELNFKKLESNNEVIVDDNIALLKSDNGFGTRYHYQVIYEFIDLNTLSIPWYNKYNDDKTVINCLIADSIMTLNTPNGQIVVRKAR